eukprot:gene4658-5443_t
MIKIFKFSAATLLCMIIAVACSKKNDAPVTGEEKPVVVAIDKDTTVTTKKIMTGSAVIKTFVSDTTIKVSEGLNQTSIVFKRADKLPVKMFILEADLKNVKLDLQAVSPYNDLLYGLQPLSAMVKDNEIKSTKIMAAINGDGFNTSTGEPTGVYYLNGVGIKPNLPAAGGIFFAVYNDKTVKIGGKDTKGVLRAIDYTKIKQAVGGNQWLIDNGLKVSTTDVTIDARTSIGYTSSGLLYAVIVDGRQTAYSNGLSLIDVRDIMASLGMVDAISLGSSAYTTFVLRSPSQASWNVVNKPVSGKEPNIANGLGFVVKD